MTVQAMISNFFRIVIPCVLPTMVPLVTWVYTKVVVEIALGILLLEIYFNKMYASHPGYLSSGCYLLMLNVLWADLFFTAVMRFGIIKDIFHKTEKAKPTDRFNKQMIGWITLLSASKFVLQLWPYMLFEKTYKWSSKTFLAALGGVACLWFLMDFIVLWKAITDLWDLEKSIISLKGCPCKCEETESSNEDETLGNKKKPLKGYLYVEYVSAEELQVQLDNHKKMKQKMKAEKEKARVLRAMKNEKKTPDQADVELINL